MDEYRGLAYRADPIRYLVRVRPDGREFVEFWHGGTAARSHFLRKPHNCAHCGVAMPVGMRGYFVNKYHSRHICRPCMDELCPADGVTTPTLLPRDRAEWNLQGPTDTADAYWRQVVTGDAEARKTA